MMNHIYKGKRVLVTGHTGFKGSWLSQWLLELGAEVAGLSLYIPSKPSHFEELGLVKKIKHYEADIRDFVKFKQCVSDFRPEIIFHLAAQPIVRRGYKEPRETFEANLMGTVNLLEIARLENSVQTMVLITTDKCYENVEWQYGYRETDKLGGKDPYSASKACCEIAASAYARAFFLAAGRPKIATTRAGNVIGGGDWGEDRIISDCMNAWSQTKSVAIRNPQATRPWQHVLEPLSGYLWLGAELHQGKSGLSGEAFNFGPHAEKDRTVLQLVEELQKTWRDSKWHDNSGERNPPAEAGLLKLSCDKVEKHLDWRATLDFSETVRMTAEWYRQFYKNRSSACELTVNQINQYCECAKERGMVWI